MGEPGAYRLGKDTVTIQIPATVQAILAARIDRLPPTISGYFRQPRLSARTCRGACCSRPREGGGRPPARAGATAGAEFVYEAKLYPDLEYTFKHALTHEVAYGSLLHDHRRALHARIVGA